ncbi:unnamed protein product [Prunus brigantina]
MSLQVNPFLRDLESQIIFFHYFFGLHYLSIYDVDLLIFHLLKQFHLKKGQCKFGAICKFHHSKDILIPSAEQENTIGETGTTIQPEGTEFAVKPLVSFSPALSFNSKELPVRPGEPDCPFYLIGSCKYGATWA